MSFPTPEIYVKYILAMVNIARIHWLSIFKRASPPFRLNDGSMYKVSILKSQTIIANFNSLNILHFSIFQNYIVGTAACAPTHPPTRHASSRGAGTGSLDEIT